MATFSLEDIFSEIDSQATAAGVNPATMKALLLSENTGTGLPSNKTIFSGDAKNPKSGAQGLFQVMPTTTVALQQRGLLPPEYQHDPSDLKSQVSVGIAAAKEMQSRQTNKADPYELATMWNASTGSWRNYVAGKLDALPAETHQFFGKLNTALTALGGGNKVPPVPQAQTPRTPQAATRYADGGNPEAAALAAKGTSDPTSFANMLASGIIAGDSQKVISSAVQQIGEAEAQRNISFAQEQAAILAEATAKGEQVAANSTIEINSAKTREKALTAFNLKDNGLTDEVSKAYQVIMRTNAAAEPLAQDIERRNAVGLFDNPLEYILNQLQLPGLVGKYNGIVGEQQRAVGALKQFQGLAASQQSITTGMQADDLAKRELADKAEVASTAQLKLTQAQTQFNTNSALMARQDLASIMSASNMDASMLVKKEHLKEVQSQEEQAATAQRFLSSIGSNRQVSATSLKLMPAKQREDLLDRASSVDGKIGASLADSIKTIELHGGSLSAIANSGGLATATWVSAAKNKANEIANKTRDEEAAIKTKPGEQIKGFELHYQAALDHIQQGYEKETANMDNASALNPFKIDYVAASKLSELKGNLVTTYINTFGPQGKTPLTSDVKGDQIINSIAAQVAQGTITSQFAEAQLKQFYSIANKNQLLATKPNVFGLNANVQGYQIKLPGQSIFGSMFAGEPQPVNLVTGQGVQAALTRLVAKYNTSKDVQAGVDSTYSRLDF